MQFAERMFKLKIKVDTYNDEARVKCSLVSALPVDWAKECQHRLDCINRLQRGEPLSAPPRERRGPGAAGVPGRRRRRRRGRVQQHGAAPASRNPFNGNYSGGGGAPNGGGYGGDEGAGGYGGGGYMGGGAGGAMGRGRGPGAGAGPLRGLLQVREEGHWANNCPGGGGAGRGPGAAMGLSVWGRGGLRGREGRVWGRRGWGGWGQGEQCMPQVWAGGPLGS